MGGEVDADTVDLSVGRFSGDDLVEKRDEGVTGVTLSGRALDVAGVGLWRGVEGQGSREESPFRSSP